MIAIDINNNKEIYFIQIKLNILNKVGHLIIYIYIQNYFKLKP